MVQWKIVLNEKETILLEIHPFFTSVFIGGRVISSQFQACNANQWAYACSSAFGEPCLGEKLRSGVVFFEGHL